MPSSQLPQECATNSSSRNKRSTDRDPTYSVVPLDIEGEPANNAEDDTRQCCVRCANQALVSLVVALLCIIIAISIQLWTSRTRWVNSQSTSTSPEPPSQALVLANTASCAENDLRTYVKSALDMPFSALLSDLRGRRKFEASDITVVADKYAYVVHDSLWAISRIDLSNLGLARSPKHVQIESGIERPDDVESDYEAIFHHNGVLYVVRESIKFHKGEESFEDKEQKGYHAVVEEIQVDDATLKYDVLDACPSIFEFETDNKGFEGAVGIVENNELYILGLCEANDCKKSHQDRPGNGKIVVMKKQTLSSRRCVWDTVKIISIPATANFSDYSAIALKEDGTVAITSQEDSTVWFGRLLHLDSMSDMMFDETVGETYSFPLSTECSSIYCNIEGLFFLDGLDLFIAVSDKMKSKGRQPYSCFQKDQSLHLFSLPFKKH